MRDQKNGTFGPESPIQLDLPRNASPLKNSKRFSLIFDDYSPTKDSVSSHPRRRHSSKSPYKPRRDDGNSEPIPNQRNANPLLRRQISQFKAQRDEVGAVSPTSNQRRQVSPYKAQRGGGAISPKPRQRNVSPLSKPDKGRQISPFKSGRKEHGMHEDGEIVRSNRMKPASFPHMDSVLLQRNKVNGNIDHNSQITSTASSGSRMTMTSAFPASRQISSKLNSDSSKISGADVSLLPFCWSFFLWFSGQVVSSG
ncbi:hypothetical protein OIU84_030098 [Salix udensis]|uniref:Uncharacterized protein n=1 Tax=Salix udensis TaxID=889485 RepID=A0AAD6KD49_9ROSI|nr:hypothetical protein OIU84_030098 [Salix udensis]